MSLIEIDKDPSREKLRTFGLLLPVFFGGLGAVAWWRWESPTVAVTILIVGGALVALYWAAAKVRRPLYVGWMYAVMPIAVVVSFVVLAGTYFLILMPIGLVRRMFGDPLERKLDREATTYWTPVRPTKDKEDYLKQF